MIKVGTDNIESIRLGNDEIVAVYIGDAKVYEKASPGPQPTFSNKIYGHTRTASSTIALKVNGTSYNVTSDANKYFELDCSGITITSLNQCAYSQSGLADITFDIDTSDCTNFASLVRGCSYVTSIDCSKLDTSKATGSGFNSLFYGARAATSIILPTSGLQHTTDVTSLMFFFFECKAITSLDLRSLGNCGNVANINGMFRRCSALETIDFSGVYFDGTEVSSDNVFGECSALTSIKVAGCDASVVTFLLSCLTSSGLSFVQSGDYLVKQS